MTRIKKIVVSLTLLILTLSGCSFKVPAFERFTEKEKQEFVEESVSLKGFKDGKIVETYDHPANLTVAEVTRSLSGIKYEALSMFYWYDEGRIFKPVEVRALAPKLTEVLSQAGPSQWAEFSVISMKDGYLGQMKHVTDGIAFVDNGKLNLVFRNINYEIPIANIEAPNARKVNRNYGDPRTIKQTDNLLRVYTDPALGVTKPAIVAGDKFRSKEHTNWAIIDTNSIAAINTEEAVAQEEKPVRRNYSEEQAPVTRAQRAPRGGPADRFILLEDLKKQGLITQEEYKQKRAKILDEI